MSSTLDPHVATNCIDNDETTRMCHSLVQVNPWISIELPADAAGSPAQVSQIVIYNRYDCCWNRLVPFQLWIGRSPGDYDSPTSRACGVQNLTVPPTPGPFAFDCVTAGGSHGAPLQGNYVTLVLPGPARTINLAEIRAFSPAFSPSPPPPSPPPPSPPPPLPPPPSPPPPSPPPPSTPPASEVGRRRQLDVSEVERGAGEDALRLGALADLKDLSTGQPTTSSSVYSTSTLASNAVDGDLSGVHPNIFHSYRGNGTYQWWAVQLSCLATNPIVTIYARDCCHSSSTYQVNILLGSNALSAGPAGTSGACATITDLTDSSVRERVCSGTGDVLILQSLHEGKYMHFGEVLVRGACLSSPG